MQTTFLLDLHLMKSPYASALTDYHTTGKSKTLWLHNSYDKPEEMPVWYFFRSYEEMSELEQMALSICDGQILDVGAGVGCHAAVLQAMGKKVMAIDNCSEAVSIMRANDILAVKEADFFQFDEGRFDTLLLLMNGLGLIGKLERLEQFLHQADQLLHPGGQIILDSSDIQYLYPEQKPKDKYYGEVQFQYEYDGQKGEWFDWVYVDMDTLTEKAYDLGWITYILHKDENDQYLARLVRK